MMMVGIFFLGMLGAAPAVDLRSPISEPWAVNVPFFRYATMADGQGSLQDYEIMFGVDPRKSQHAWVEFNAAATRNLLTLGASSKMVAFGFRHALFNLNTFQFAEATMLMNPTPATTVDPIESNNVAEDRKWLASGGAAEACILLTLHDQAEVFPPAIDNSALIDAAQDAGFHASGTMTMPNKQKIQIWKRSIPNCG